jgi:hypothetical protein
MKHRRGGRLNVALTQSVAPGNDRNWRNPDGRCRRIADVADRGLGRLVWADSDLWPNGRKVPGSGRRRVAGKARSPPKRTNALEEHHENRRAISSQTIRVKTKQSAKNSTMQPCSVAAAAPPKVRPSMFATRGTGATGVSFKKPNSRSRIICRPLESKSGEKCSSSAF